jgi:regulator of sirC expression with transglutaminase-like and TPR domain
MSPAEPSAARPEGDRAAGPARIDALIRLLGDENPRICSVAWENLEKIGDAALPVVRQATRDAPDARVQAQCARFLKEWRRREALRRWVEFCRSGKLGLEEGAFLIAQTEFPEAELDTYRRMLDGFAESLRGRLASARTVDEAVAAVSRLLFEELGFRGNDEDYYSPDNSYLNRVLDLKRGIPISLASVFLLVARRVQVPVCGVGLPQHFVLKYRGAAGEVFVDTFRGGKLLGVRECVRFLSNAHIPFLEDYLRAVSDAEMLTRMLGNLLKIYLSQDDQRRSDRISAMLKLLPS